MTDDFFSKAVSDAIGLYVYRLIDPRNGQTFYVGKGRGNRVFEHAAGELRSLGLDDEADLKTETIRHIRLAGLEVMHLIHRHKLLDDEVAYEVEAALMDAYGGLANVVGGHGSLERGCRSTKQLIAQYDAQKLDAEDIKEDLILIYIGQTSDDRKVYDAVRGIWKMNRSKAEKRHLVLAYDGSLIVGAYRPNEWLPGTKENFPFLKGKGDPTRIGFSGSEAESKTWNHYVGRQAPARKKGDRSPFRYLNCGGVEATDL